MIETAFQSLHAQSVIFDTVAFVGEAARLLSASDVAPDSKIVILNEKLSLLFTSSKKDDRFRPEAASEAWLRNLSTRDSEEIAKFGILTGLFDPKRTCFVWLDDSASSGRPSFQATATFASIIVLFEETAGRPPDFWHWAKDLFDVGYVACRETRTDRYIVAPYVRSDAVLDVDAIGGYTRGRIAMSSLGLNGRFANQLFQYAFVYFYSLRHSLELITPEWEGKTLFGLRDSWDADHGLPKLQFFAFDDDDLELWDIDDPPINFDAWGYFQELPHCWTYHRDLLRKRLKLTIGLAKPLEAWLAVVTDNGRRSLVGIHIRRGDYVTLQSQGLPWYRTIPEAWYLKWLEKVWPTLNEPILYIATDAPNEVIPEFEKYAPVSLGSLPDKFDIPDYVLDFEILRRVNYLAIANSSFSRMAGILGEKAPICARPDFKSESFITYDPWPDDNFWSNFTDGSHKDRGMGNDLAAVRRRSVNLRIELATAREVSDYYKNRHDRLTEVLDYRDRTIVEKDQRIFSADRENESLNRQLSEIAANSKVLQQNIKETQQNLASTQQKLASTQQKLASTQQELYWNSFAGLSRRIAFRILLIVIKTIEYLVGSLSKPIKSYCLELEGMIMARQHRKCLDTIAASFKMRLRL